MGTVWTFLLKVVLLILSIVLLFGEYKISIFIKDNTVLRSLFQFVIYYLSLRIIAKSIYFTYAIGKKKALNARDNFFFGLLNIARLLISIGLLVTIFNCFGIDIRTLLTSLSIVAAAITVIMKEYINDFLVGLYYSFTSNIGIGDYVKIANHRGKILEIKMLKIKLLNEDNDLVILPNSMVYANEIINYTKRDVRSMSIDFQLDIKVIRDVETLERELILALGDFEPYIEEESYQLKIVDLKKDAIDVKFLYTLKSLNVDVQKRIRRKTIRRVYNYISAKNQ